LLIVCQVKIYLICLAAIPFLIDRKIVESIIASVLILATFAFNYVIAPDLFHQFNETLVAVMNVPGYVGTSVMTAAQVLLGKAHLSASMVSIGALAVHGVYAFLVVVFAATVLWTRARPERSWVFLWTLMAALLISPRLAEYDMSLMVIPFLFFLGLLIERRDIGFGVAVAGFVTAISLVRTPFADWGAFIALFGVWLGIGLSWLAQAGSGRSVKVS
jgi:hypothetical protein